MHFAFYLWNPPKKCLHFQALACKSHCRLIKVLPKSVEPLLWNLNFVQESVILWSCHREYCQHHSISILPLLHSQEKTNLRKGFSNENTQLKFLFPADRQAHHWAAIRFYCWKKIKTRTTILPSKEQNLFWLCMNSGHNLIILSVLQSPDSTAWQSSLTTDVVFSFLWFQNWIILQ